MSPFLPTSSSISRVASKDSDVPERFYSPEPERHIKDIIYDLIPVAPYLTRFIDTRPFQRLRNVKQLGTTFYVWPSASHSRFEHSLGVAYLARCLASHLQRSQPELNITDRDVACVEIAGLCHDLGHGPWSHVWDGIFMKNTPFKNWQHEQGSVMMFDYIIENYSVPMPEKDIVFVKALIDGDSGKASPDEKKFLFDIVANKRNGIDVDKLDYIQRDSRMLGEIISISLPRILKSARVINDEITYNIKDADSIYNICLARYRLHKAFYNHKSAKAIEYMIVDALLSAEPHLKIAERVMNPERFIHLSDIIMNTIEDTTDPELEEAREIFARIRHRDLYKCVDYKVVDWELLNTFKKFITPEKIVEAIRSLPPMAVTPSTEETLNVDSAEQVDPPSAQDMTDMSESLEGLQAEDIIVDFAPMHYGMKAQNPLECVKFYSKTQPNTAATAPPGVHSGLVPHTHAEVMLRIFTKKSKYYGLAQAGFRQLLVEMDKSVGQDPSFAECTSQRMVTPPPSNRSEADTEIDNNNMTETIPTSPVVAPSTPGPSTAVLPGSPPTAIPVDKKRPFSRHTSGSFDVNPFTGVPLNFAPQSPSARSTKSLSKRQSGGDFSRTTPLAPSPLVMGNSMDSIPPFPHGDPLASPPLFFRTLKRAREQGSDENDGIHDKKRKA